MLAPRTATSTALVRGPFDPDCDKAFRAWRDSKLEQYPARTASLIVEIGDPKALSCGEREALADRVRRANFVVYASRARDDGHAIARDLGTQFGLVRLDANWLADEDGVSEIKVDATGSRGDFIPYTDRAIRWHTDGYYNAPQRRVRAMVLHCVRNAASGGESGLLDHEIAYLLLRELDPAHVRALMRDDAMTIPARTDDSGVARPAQSGPVFSIDPADGTLHMRYTARTRSIEWNDDPRVRAAAAALAALLAAPSPWIHRLALEPGMGVLCNNVLHERTGFTDDPASPRLMLRARYCDRIDDRRRIGIEQRDAAAPGRPAERE
jgi:hypothetical protein